MVAAALRHHARAKSSSLAILVIDMPDAIDSFIHAGRLFLRQVLKWRGYSDPFVRSINVKKSDRPGEREIFRRAAEDGKGLLLCSNLDDVDEEVGLFADLVATLPKPSTRQIIASFRRFGHVLSRSDQEMIASESWTRLVYAFQPDRPVKEALRRLRETANRTSPSTAEVIKSGPTLEDLSGLGPAKDWGLELARDIADYRSGVISWDDVSAGALVFGPPGTGKTLFAEALARTCELPIVVASAARWQASGYLNDLLKSMRESFREAQSHGTALLFVDELDAIGNRALNDSQHADYKRQVINGLLELLDGFDRRRGVVVIGATNHQESVDAAILRPGRLGRQLEILLPNASNRRQIFEFHAKFPIPPDQEERFARSTEGMSGAALEELVRDGRRVARRRRATFGFEHIVEVAKPFVEIPAELMKVAAYHEAGHAIVGVQLGMKLEGISITDKVVIEGVNTLGGALFAQPTFALKTRSFFLNNICMFLAGLAAEAIIFGEFTEAADDPRSDLALATALATRVEGTFGMGGTLAITIAEERDLGRLRATDSRLRAAVDELLAKEFKRAMTILDVRQQALRAIAETLLEAKVMAAEAINNALQKHPAKVDPLAADTDNPEYPVRIVRQAIHQLHGDEVRREMDAALRRWGMV